MEKPKLAIDNIRHKAAVIRYFSKADCKHPRNKRVYIGGNMLRCTLCGKEFK